ncbi:glycoside hydrolase family 3 N-terminal domain-containing protein [Bradyrhizobium sp. RDM12]
MSTQAFNTGASGTELTAAERAFGRAECSWDLILFRRSIEISRQVAVLPKELAVTRVTAADLGSVSIPVDGVPEPAHPVTTSATMIAQVIRSAIGFQGLLMSDDVPMSTPAGGIAERTHAMFAAGCDTTIHSNDNAERDALIAITASA